MYRGLGQTCVNGVDPATGNPCFSATVMSSSGPSTADLSQLPLTGPYVGTSPAALANQAALSLALTPTPAGVPVGQSVSQWLSANSSYVWIAGLALVALLLIPSGRRR
jgi:hypothetical protein